MLVPAMEPPHLELVLCTAPDQAVAERLAAALVGERLAACVNLVPEVASVYRWEGAVQRDREVLLIIKTASDRRAELEARVRALHPYQVPELVALRAAHVAEAYHAWLVRETRSADGHE